jgi:shikimate kinase
VSRPVAVLIGPPGSGKTTVAAVLAELLGVSAHDTDAAVEAGTGRSISDIFVQDGEASFRALERQETLEALRTRTGVVALGGGAVMQPEVAAALREGGHTVVFLDVSIADASRRIGFDAARPLLVVNPRASWTRLMNTRRPTYRALATVVVDTAGATPEDVAARIVAELPG